jgi:crotonobetainyl-CoA:carnitine CoA-transferase CaiB-like acyl-CoA transferase
MNHRDSLIPILQKVFLTRAYEEWEPLLLENDIPVGAINHLGQVVEHPQVKARGTLIELEHPRVGRVRAVRSPVRLSRTPAQARTAAPIHGQHTREVLSEVLGLSAEEIARLETAGAVASS